MKIRSSVSALCCVSKLLRSSHMRKIGFQDTMHLHMPTAVLWLTLAGMFTCLWAAFRLIPQFTPPQSVWQEAKNGFLHKTGFIWEWYPTRVMNSIKAFAGFIAFVWPHSELVWFTTWPHEYFGHLLGSIMSVGRLLDSWKMPPDRKKEKSF